MQFRDWSSQGSLLAWRRIGIEKTIGPQHAAVGVEDRLAKKVPELDQTFQPLGLAGRIRDLHGGHLFGEVSRKNVQNPLAKHRAGGVTPLVKSHVEGGVIAPDLEPCITVSFLAAMQK